MQQLLAILGGGKPPRESSFSEHISTQECTPCMSSTRHTSKVLWPQRNTNTSTSSAPHRGAGRTDAHGHQLLHTAKTLHNSSTIATYFQSGGRSLPARSISADERPPSSCGNKYGGQRCGRYTRCLPRLFSCGQKHPAPGPGHSMVGSEGLEIEPSLQSRHEAGAQLVTAAQRRQKQRMFRILIAAVLTISAIIGAVFLIRALVRIRSNGGVSLQDVTCPVGQSSVSVLRGQSACAVEPICSCSNLNGNCPGPQRPGLVLGSFCGVIDEKKGIVGCIQGKKPVDYALPPQCGLPVSTTTAPTVSPSSSPSATPTTARGFGGGGLGGGQVSSSGDNAGRLGGSGRTGAGALPDAIGQATSRPTTKPSATGKPTITPTGSAPTSTNASDGPSVGALFGIVASAIICVVIVILFLVYTIKQRRKMDESTLNSNTRSSNDSDTLDLMNVGGPGRGNGIGGALAQDYRESQRSFRESLKEPLPRINALGYVESAVRERDQRNRMRGPTSRRWSSAGPGVDSSAYGSAAAYYLGAEPIVSGAGNQAQQPQRASLPSTLILTDRYSQQSPEAERRFQNLQNDADSIRGSTQRDPYRGVTLYEGPAFAGSTLEKSSATPTSQITPGSPSTSPQRSPLSSLKPSSPSLSPPKSAALAPFTAPIASFKHQIIGGPQHRIMQGSLVSESSGSDESWKERQSQARSIGGVTLFQTSDIGGMSNSSSQRQSPTARSPKTVNSNQGRAKGYRTSGTLSASAAPPVTLYPTGSRPEASQSTTPASEIADTTYSTSQASTIPFVTEGRDGTKVSASMPGDKVAQLKLAIRQRLKSMESHGSGQGDEQRGNMSKQVSVDAKANDSKPSSLVGASAPLKSLPPSGASSFGSGSSGSSTPLRPGIAYLNSFPSPTSRTNQPLSSTAQDSGPKAPTPFLQSIEQPRFHQQTEGSGLSRIPQLFASLVPFRTGQSTASTPSTAAAEGPNVTGPAHLPAQPSSSSAATAASGSRSIAGPNQQTSESSYSDSNKDDNKGNLSQLFRHDLL